MKLIDLLNHTAKLVDERVIINHGSIRCLRSKEAEKRVLSAEDCEEVEMDIIGDYRLSQALKYLNFACLSQADANNLAEAIKGLEYAYCGENISDYICENEEDELILLEELIDAAQIFIDEINQ